MKIITLENSINPVKTSAEYNEQGEETSPEVLKTDEEINAEKQVLIAAKTSEIQTQCVTYENAKDYQRNHGGPGPVAKHLIMEICNQHEGNFKVEIE